MQCDTSSLQVNKNCDKSSIQYRETKRHLWWMYHAPKIAAVLPSRNHIEEIEIYPELAWAYEIIQRGQPAVLAVKEPNLTEILADTLVNCRPDEDEIRLIEGAYSRQLTADGKWPDTNETLIIPNENDPGWGKWPAKPMCQCGGSGLALTLKAKELYWARIKRRRYADDKNNRKVCPACFYERVQRLAKQILHELCENKHKFFWIEIAEDTFKTITDNWRGRRRSGHTVIYKTFPQNNDTRIIIHNQAKDGGEIVSDNKAELFKWLWPIAGLCDDKNTSSSQGFGGPWQGNKGDGRTKKGAKVPYIQFWSDEDADLIADVLGIEEIGDRHAGRINVSAESVLERLRDAGIDIHQRTNGKYSLEAFKAELEAIRKAEEGEEDGDKSTM